MRQSFLRRYNVVSNLLCVRQLLEQDLSTRHTPDHLDMLLEELEKLALSATTIKILEEKVWSTKRFLSSLEMGAAQFELDRLLHLLDQVNLADPTEAGEESADSEDFK